MCVLYPRVFAWPARLLLWIIILVLVPDCFTAAIRSWLKWNPCGCVLATVMNSGMRCLLLSRFIVCTAYPSTAYPSTAYPSTAYPSRCLCRLCRLALHPVGSV